MLLQTDFYLYNLFETFTGRKYFLLFANYFHFSLHLLQSSVLPYIVFVLIFLQMFLVIIFLLVLLSFHWPLAQLLIADAITVATFFRSCVAQALGRGDGPRHS